MLTSLQPRVLISFLAPYHTESDACTGVQMIKAGFAEAVPQDAASGVLLSPAAAETLSPLDLGLALAGGLRLIDGPWEKLDEEARTLQERGVCVRRLPSYLEPFNDFYRRRGPKYYFSPCRFGTAEAAAYALAVLNDNGRAQRLADRLGFRSGYAANLRVIQKELF
jgi:ribosome biogenesis protein Tsr3